MMRTKCKELLEKEGVSLDSEIDFDVNGEIYTLSFEFILGSFMQASSESQLAFFEAIKEAAMSKDGGIEKFFEGMGQLLLMTHLSQNIELP